MKKSLLIMLLCLLGVTRSTAQSSIQFGVRFDPEFSGYQNSNDANDGAELQYASHFSELSFGAGAIYNFNTHIGFGIDILFSREGQAYSGTFNGIPPRADAYSAVVDRQITLNGITIVGNYVALAELNYIKVPLMLSLATDNTQQFYFTALVGPQIDFLHGIAQEVNKEDLDYPNTSVTPYDLYSTITLSAMLALGASCNLSSQWVISARLRFDYGFSDAENKDVMISYAGTKPVRFYSPDRTAVHSESAGLMLGLDYKL
jgi:hypothetical protein